MSRRDEVVFEVAGQRCNIAPQLVHVSDTFVLYADWNCPADIAAFLWIANQILFYSVLHEFPTRGAVAVGDS